MSEDICKYLYNEIFFCSHPNSNSTSNNREYLGKGLYYTLSELDKAIKTYFSN